FHSTTRSPILTNPKEEYGARNGLSFKNPFDPKIENFVYNIDTNRYKQVCFITERQISSESRNELIRCFLERQIRKIKFISVVQ
ncbi:MAG: TRSP domain-containing protein, partial [Blastocatellia bacterium]|nr:TRSP domain-containing protein [Blastocatellia bacterium]